MARKECPGCGERRPVDEFPTDCLHLGVGEFLRSLEPCPWPCRCGGPTHRPCAYDARKLAARCRHRTCKYGLPHERGCDGEPGCLWSRHRRLTCVWCHRGARTAEQHKELRRVADTAVTPEVARGWSAILSGVSDREIDGVPGPVWARKAAEKERPGILAAVAHYEVHRDRRRARYAEDSGHARSRAIRNGMPWLEAEDRIVQDRDISTLEAALALGRTVAAVGMRRHVLTPSKPNLLPG